MLVFGLYSLNLCSNLLFFTPCYCILWLTCDEINQIKLCLLQNWTSCSCQALLPSQPVTVGSESQTWAQKFTKRKTTNNLFNKDIFRGVTIDCVLWFKFTICARHRAGVWAACLWRIGMQRKSQRTLGHHETDTEVWNERDRAGVNRMCACVFVGE